jgi:hypothetical protein
MRKLVAFAVLGLLYLLGCGDSAAEQLRDGDIIFQTSRSDQSVAIQKATHSPCSHMGIVFLRNGSPYVYEAIDTVQYTPLRKWVDVVLGSGIRDMVEILYRHGPGRLATSYYFCLSHSGHIALRPNGFHHSLRPGEAGP